MGSYFDVLVYFYSKNIIDYTFPIKKGRRTKIWISSNPTTVTDIEFLLDEESQIEVGQFQKVKIAVVNPGFYLTLVNSGQRIFFGEVRDNRLGEIIPFV